VQKTPVEGRVIASELTRGRKVAAFRHDAGDLNEKHLTVFERAGGERVGVRQIAGLVARRVVCYLEPGRQVARGDPLGIIKFGSRVDVLVPEQYEILVSKGDRVRTAATPIARPAETPAAGP
jgi:phosphatidylserine decarboxylase